MRRSLVVRTDVFSRQSVIRRDREGTPDQPADLLVLRDDVHLADEVVAATLECAGIVRIGVARHRGRRIASRARRLETVEVAREAGAAGARADRSAGRAQNTGLRK